MQPVRLIAGLGNPGAGYAQTRHNAGFWLVDALARSAGADWRHESRFGGDTARIRRVDHELWLLRPTTFMNRSGQAVRALADFYKLQPDTLLVVHDDLDLPPGVARLKRGGGHGGHNGLRDIHRHLGTDNYLRLRMGIGHPGHRSDVLDYVLAKPRPEDARAIEGAVDRALVAIDALLQHGWDRACTLLHTAPS